MKNTDDTLRDLAALARQAPVQPEAPMPEGFAVNTLRRLSDRPTPIVWVLWEQIVPRFLAAAAAVCFLILGFCLWFGTSAEPPELAMANAAVERMLLP